MLQHVASESSDLELAERVLSHRVGVGCPQPSGAEFQTVQPRAVFSRCCWDSDFQSQSQVRTQNAGRVWGSGQGGETWSLAQCSPGPHRGSHTWGTGVQGHPRGAHRDREALVGMTTASLWPGPLPTPGRAHSLQRVRWEMEKLRGGDLRSNPPERY